MYNDIKQEGRYHTTLCGTSIRDMKCAGRVTDFGRLRPIKEKDKSPISHGRIYIQQKSKVYQTA